MMIHCIPNFHKFKNHSLYHSNPHSYASLTYYGTFYQFNFPSNAQV